MDFVCDGGLSDSFRVKEEIGSVPVHTGLTPALPTKILMSTLPSPQHVFHTGIRLYLLRYPTLWSNVLVQVTRRILFGFFFWFAPLYGCLDERSQVNYDVLLCSTSVVCSALWTRGDPLVPTRDASVQNLFRRTSRRIQVLYTGKQEREDCGARGNLTSESESRSLRLVRSPRV